MAQQPEEQKTTGNSLAPATIADLVQNQKRELEIRAEELRLKAQEDQHAFAHAGKVLEAQERDRKDQRQACHREAVNRYRFIGIITIVSLLFIVTLVCLGKDQVALDIVKTAVSLITGAIGGFFYGKDSAKAPPKGSAENDSDGEVVEG